MAFLVVPGKRVIYDAEHFFDGYREDPEYASPACAPRRSRAPSASCCATPTGRRCRTQVAAATRAVREQLGEEILVGIHCHNDMEVAVANSLAAVAEGATQVQGTMNGIGERTGNANLVTLIANLQVALDYDLIGAERLTRLTETAHFVDELLNKNPDPAAAWVGRSAFAHKGGLHVRASGPTRRRSSTTRRSSWATSASCWCPSSRASTPSWRRRPPRGSRWTTRPPRAYRAGQGPRAPGLPVRGGRRVVRAAAAPGGRRLRAAVPAGVLAGDRRAARRRQGRDRGDRQGLARRRALRADRGGQRPGQRAGRRAARRDRAGPPAPGVGRSW